MSQNSYLTFYEKAGVLLAGGIQLDENEEWKDAVRYYSKAMEYLLAGTSYDRLRTRREKKLQLLKHVMERAETIQKNLTEYNNKQDSSFSNQCFKESSNSDTQCVHIQSATKAIPEVEQHHQ